MSRKIINIDPVSRVSGLLEISVIVENNTIIEANCSGLQFRGFEEMFKQRPPLDMPYLTARTCGICSVHHALAATLSLEEAMGITPSANGVLVRELANGFELLQNHIRHFYQFVIPDYVNLEGVNPLQKTDASRANFRLPKELNDKLAKNYFLSLPFSRRTHSAVAILAGKAPHPHGIFVGGTTTNISIIQFSEIRSILRDVKEFINAYLIPDAYTIAENYNDYYEMGQSYGNFIAESLFSETSFPVKYSEGGVLINGEKEVLDVSWITENLKYSWLEAPNNISQIDALTPMPNADKPDAYSWVTAPRYKGYAMEVGPLARMYLSGAYTRGISAMDRILARVLETQKICDSLEGLLSILELEPAFQTQWLVPQSGSGIGIVSASRGILMHFLEIDQQVVKSYNLIPPSNWNFSPKDNNNLRGAVEEALIGTPIQDVEYPVEIGRIVRTFDPCLNCAAHVVSDRYKPLRIRIV